MPDEPAAHNEHGLEQPDTLRPAQPAPQIPEVLRGPGEDEQRIRAARAHKLHKRKTTSISRTLNQTGKVWSIGIDFGASVIAGVLIGFVFDYFFGTKPWGIVGWAVLGIASGFVRFIRQALKANRQQIAQLRGKAFQALDDDGVSGR